MTPPHEQRDGKGACILLSTAELSSLSRKCPGCPGWPPLGRPLDERFLGLILERSCEGGKRELLAFIFKRSCKALFSLCSFSMCLNNSWRRLWHSASVAGNARFRIPSFFTAIPPQRSYQ